MYAKEIETVSSLLRVNRRFNYIQIGVSSNCFLSCSMCPRTCFLERWNSIDMTIEVYKNISRFFPYTKNVYLSGWGEPLLNTRFLEMIQIAKAADCSVGFTTNGALLDDTMSRKIIDMQTDLVSLSLAGIITETHESMRVGSDFEQLSSNIRSLADLKKHLQSDEPQILLLFMMTMTNINELPSTIEFAADVGANGVVATNLDYVAVPLHDKLKAFSCFQADEVFVERIKEAEERARETGVSFNAFPLEKKPVKVCSEDPLHNLYISEDGYISPCVYLNPPIKEIPRIFCGEKVIIPRTRFGNIKEKNLLEIWKSHEYTSFRKKYKSRLKSDQNKSVDDLPEVCKTCYKAYGI